MAGHFMHTRFVFRDRLREFGQERTGDNCPCPDRSKSDREDGAVGGDS